MNAHEHRWEAHRVAPDSYVARCKDCGAAPDRMKQRSTICRCDARSCRDARQHIHLAIAWAERSGT